MSLNFELRRPSVPIFAISLVLALFAVAGVVLPVPFVTEHAFWFGIAAYVVLVLGILGVLEIKISVPSK